MLAVHSFGVQAFPLLPCCVDHLIGRERRAAGLCYAGCIMEVTNFFCIVVESGGLKLLGRLRFFINK